MTTRKTQHTHRRTLARRLAAAEGLAYQDALARVRAAAEAGRLPDRLDDAGLAEALTVLRAPAPGPGPAAAHPGPATGETAAGSVPAPTTMVLRFSDLQRCPKRSMLPSHFRPDGSCRCDEREDAAAEVAAARADLAAARERLQAAQRHLDVT